MSRALTVYSRREAAAHGMAQVEDMMNERGCSEVAEGESSAGGGFFGLQSGDSLGGGVAGGHHGQVDPDASVLAAWDA